MTQKEIDRIISDGLDLVSSTRDYLNTIFSDGFDEDADNIEISKDELCNGREENIELFNNLNKISNKLGLRRRLIKDASKDDFTYELSSDHFDGVYNIYVNLEHINDLCDYMIDEIDDKLKE